MPPKAPKLPSVNNNNVPQPVNYKLPPRPNSRSGADSQVNKSSDKLNTERDRSK